MENNQASTLQPISQDNNNKEAIFIHRCCNDGYKFLKEFAKEHSEVVVKSINMLPARDMKLPELYGFNLNDLHKHVFIWYDNKLLIGDI
jgi:hypothetical protein